MSLRGNEISPSGSDLDLGEHSCLFFWLVSKDSAFLERGENLADLSPAQSWLLYPEAVDFHPMGSLSIREDGSDPPRRKGLSFLLAS